MVLDDSRKLIATRHSFQIFLVNSRLLEQKTGSLAHYTNVIVWENQISRKLILVK